VAHRRRGFLTEEIFHHFSPFDPLGRRAAFRTSCRGAGLTGTEGVEWDRDGILLERGRELRQVIFRQGPWNVDLRTPPGQECSNGSLLCIRRGHPGILNFRLMICDWRSINAVHA